MGDMKKNRIVHLFLKTLINLLYVIVISMIPLIIGFIIDENQGDKSLVNFFFYITAVIYIVGVVFIITIAIYTNNLQEKTLNKSENNLENKENKGKIKEEDK